MSDNNSSLAAVGCRCRERIHHRSVHWPVCYHHQPGSVNGHPLRTVGSKGRGAMGRGASWALGICWTVQVARLQTGESQDRALKLTRCLLHGRDNWRLTLFPLHGKHSLFDSFDWWQWNWWRGRGGEETILSNVMLLMPFISLCLGLALYVVGKLKLAAWTSWTGHSRAGIAGWA